MSDSFKRILRTKTAEQLTNMLRNKDGWTQEEHVLISEEVRNRGLEIFEEPEEWTDQVMEDVDLVSPKSEFEKDMAYLTKDKEKYNREKGMRLASQIVSIASVIIGFGFLYLYRQSVMMFGISTTIKLSMVAVALGIAGLILFIMKRYLQSLIFSGGSLLFTLAILLMNLQRLLG